jgi:two-component system response regulator
VPIDILLVEDNPNDEELALHALRKYHLTNRVFVVRDGEEALDYMFARGPFTDRATHPLPTVVLLDLKLPKVGGLEVLQQVKSDPRTMGVPVVILTSSAEDQDIGAGYEYGANSFIVKPVDFQQFTEAVRSLGMYWVLLNRPFEAN